MLSDARLQTARRLFDRLQHFFINDVLSNVEFCFGRCDRILVTCQNLDTILADCTVQDDADSFELLHLVFFSLEIELEQTLVHPDVHLMELVHALVAISPNTHTHVFDRYTQMEHHGLLLSRFLVFFASTPRFMRCAVYKTENPVAGLSTVPLLFLTLMSGAGLCKPFGVLLQYDAREKARWAYRTVADFFVYLHENYKCVQNKSRVMSGSLDALLLTERLEKLKLILLHNGKPFLMTVFAWDHAEISHSCKTSHGTMAGFYIENSMQVLSAHTRLSRTIFPKLDVGISEVHGYESCNSYLRAFEMIVASCPEALAVKYCTKNAPRKNSFQSLECMWSRRRDFFVFPSRIHFLTYQAIHRVVLPHMTLHQFVKERSSSTGLTIQERNDELHNDPAIHEHGRVMLKNMRNDFLVAIGMMSQPNLAAPHRPNKTLLMEIVCVIGLEVMKSMDQKIATHPTHSWPRLWLTSRGPDVVRDYQSDSNGSDSDSNSDADDDDSE